MTSKVMVANLGLVSLGERKISAFTEVSSPLTEEVFDAYVDAVLGNHPWNCAKSRASLNSLSTPPIFGFTYAYELPADLLRVLGTDQVHDNWKIEGNRLLSNTSSVSIRYLQHIDDMNRIRPWLRSVIGKFIGYSLAQDLTQKQNLSDTLFKEYEILLGQARTFNAQESGEDLDHGPGEDGEGSVWLQSRR